MAVSHEESVCVSPTTNNRLLIISISILGGRDNVVWMPLSSVSGRGGNMGGALSETLWEYMLATSSCLSFSCNDKKSKIIVHNTLVFCFFYLLLAAIVVF